MKTVAQTCLDPAALKAAGERVRLRQAAEAFEALMVQTLLKSMSEAQLEDGFFGAGPGASTYQGMFEEQFAEKFSQGSPFGIARMLEQQLAGRLDAAHEVEGALRKAAEARAREAYGAAIKAGRGAPPPPAPPALERSTPVTLPADAAPTSGPAPLRGSTSKNPMPSQVSRPGSPDFRHTSSYVSSPFGWRRDPFDGSLRFHQGVDLPAPQGTPVVAVAPGEVVSADRKAGFGLEVLVRHAKGWITRYAHLSATDVEPGQKVDRGSLLGKVGSTGRSTGPHLHFEAVREGQTVDPAVAAPGSLPAQVLRDRADET